MELVKMKLNECCLSISDGDHQPPPKTDKGIPFVTIANINNNKFDFANTMFVPLDYYESLDEKRKAKIGDVLYTVVGSFGIPVYIDEDVKFVFQRHIAILRPNPQKVDSRFLYYLMLGRDFYAKADAIALGAAQRTVSLTSLRNMEIELPSKDVQKKIADILSMYDKLIENNRNQIKLLEEAAQRLYKEWFVDLHFPGYEDVAIVDGVPEGWKSGFIDDVVIETGKKEKKEKRNNYNYYLPIDCMPKMSLGYIQTNDVSLAESSLVGFKKGDILFGAMRPYFHKVVIARDKGLTRTTCFVLNAKDSTYWSFVAMMLFAKDTVDYATQISVGTTMPYVRWKDMKNMSVLIPDSKTAKMFNKEIQPIIDNIANLSEMITLLQQARDRLLPKLMSGELEV